MYKEKYLKYKLKYLDLKGQIGGGQLIYHGTNLFYIDDIMTNGLTGKYNEKIFDIMNTYYDTIKGSSKTGYIELFFNRQDNVRENPSDIALSFTGKLDIAEEYSTGARHFGEGPSRFYKLFEEYIYKNKDKISDDMRKDYETINNAYKHPGIILAVDIDNIKDKRKFPEGSDYSKQPEITLTNPIDKSLLYIKIYDDIKDDGAFVLLTSDEGGQYIQRLKNQFLEEQEEEQRKIDEMIKHRTQLKEKYGEGSSLEQDTTKKTKPLSDWFLLEGYDKLDDRYYVTNTNQDNSYLIDVKYRKDPSSLLFLIRENDYIIIQSEMIYNSEKKKYILSPTYLLNGNNKKFKLFMSDRDLKTQFDLAMSHIYEIIPVDEKQKIKIIVNYILLNVEKKV